MSLGDAMAALRMAIGANGSAGSQRWPMAGMKAGPTSGSDSVIVDVPALPDDMSPASPLSPWLAMTQPPSLQTSGLYRASRCRVHLVVGLRGMP